MKTTRRLFLRSAALAGAAAVVAGRSLAATQVPASGTADFWEIVRSRRSVRRFKADAPVPEEHVVRILEAARMCPTSGNQQPWKFLVVRDPARIRALKEACVNGYLEYFDQHRDQFKESREKFESATRASYEGYMSAPVYVVILTDNRSTYPDYNHYDGPLAAATLMLAARALGYGTVFLTDSIPPSITKKVLHIPDHYTQVCITPLGVPTEWPATPKKKPLNELVAYEELKE